jgi:DNA-binding CsgD family transcriptional regulator
VYEPKDRLPPDWLTITLWKPNLDTEDEPFDKSPITDEDVAFMLDLYRKGQSLEQIADVMYYSVPRVRGRIDRAIKHGLIPRREHSHCEWGPEREEELIRLFNAGNGQNALARILGLPVSTIYSKLRYLRSKKRIGYLKDVVSHDITLSLCHNEEPSPKLTLRGR